MKFKLEILFDNPESRAVAIKILNRIKENSNLAPLDLGNLSVALQDMQVINESEN